MAVMIAGERVNAVKSRWSMENLITVLTGELVPASRKIPSIFNPDERTPSMHIYDDHFYDYSTGKSGDVIELLRMVKHLSFEDAVEALEEEADVERLPVVERVEQSKEPFRMPEINPYLPLPAPVDGVSLDVWQQLFRTGRLGMFDSSLGIVHHDWEGHAIGVKYRDADGRKWAAPGSQFTKSLYWVNKRISSVQCVIVEGESDLWAWLSATQHYWGQPQLFALPSGASGWSDTWLEMLEPFESVWICMDNDEAGKRARDKIALKVGYGRAEFVNVPPLYNDVRAAVIAGWQPPKLL